MKDQPIYIQDIIHVANKRVDNLLVSLQFIKSCFKYLPYQKVSEQIFSVTYYYGETLEFDSIDKLINELKRCVSYQMGHGREISIPAGINVSQKMIVNQGELELFYYGNLILHNTAGWISYCWYQSTPTVTVDLRESTTGEIIFSLFKNFQEAISDQIQKNQVFNQHRSIRKAGLVLYSDLADLPLSEAIAVICNCTHIRYADMLLSDLLLTGAVDDLKLSDYLNPSYYGTGVYVFFDGDVPVYVDKAENFLHRLSSHRSIDPRPNWGWNALLQKVCAKRLYIESNHTRENLMDALTIVEGFGVVRVLLDREDAIQKLSQFERLILKGINSKFNTLLNRGIGKIDNSFIKKQLKKIML